MSNNERNLTAEHILEFQESRVETKCRIFIFNISEQNADGSVGDILLYRKHSTGLTPADRDMWAQRYFLQLYVNFV